MSKHIQAGFKARATGNPDLFKVFSNPEEKLGEKEKKKEQQKMNQTWTNAQLMKN